MPNQAYEDAYEIFESYILLNGAVPRSLPLGPGNNLYPHPITQQDTIVFSTVFSIIWETMKREKSFAAEYKAKPKAFAMLTALADGNGFWVMDPKAAKPTLKRQKLNKPHLVEELCRTLRNGLNHFNYRWVNRTPRDYFKSVGLSVPDEIVDPDVGHFRVFIYDYRELDKDRKPYKFMDLGSNTRILDVGFGHLRWCLHLFLVQFFKAEGVGVVKDVFGNPMP